MGIMGGEAGGDGQPSGGDSSGGWGARPPLRCPHTPFPFSIHPHPPQMSPAWLSLWGELGPPSFHVDVLTPSASECDYL